MKGSIGVTDNEKMAQGLDKLKAHSSKVKARRSSKLIPEGDRILLSKGKEHEFGGSPPETWRINPPHCRRVNHA
jgi:hypothetical protein